MALIFKAGKWGLGFNNISIHKTEKFQLFKLFNASSYQPLTKWLWNNLIERKTKRSKAVVFSDIFRQCMIEIEICTIFQLPLDVMLRGHKTSNYKCSLPSLPIHGFSTFFLQYLSIRFQLQNIQKLKKTFIAFNVWLKRQRQRDGLEVREELSMETWSENQCWKCPSPWDFVCISPALVFAFWSFWCWQEKIGFLRRRVTDRSNPPKAHISRK